MTTYAATPQYSLAAYTVTSADFVRSDSLAEHPHSGNLEYFAGQPREGIHLAHRTEEQHIRPPNSTAESNLVGGRVFLSNAGDFWPVFSPDMTARAVTRTRLARNPCEGGSARSRPHVVTYQ